MAEIKSTLDLVMEKTKGMLLSEEEKRKIKLSERVEKIRGLVDGYLQGKWSKEKLKKEIEALSTGFEKEVYREVWQSLLDRFDFGEEGRKCLEALALFTNEEEYLNKLDSLWSEYQETYNQWLAERRLQLTSELARLGISGSAILPLPPNDLGWSDKKQEFNRRLTEIREAWKSAAK